jgi:outer membrane biosynthesis protein TonB
MNGTINATSRRDLLIQKDDNMEHTAPNTEPVKTAPTPTPTPKPKPKPSSKPVKAPNITPKVTPNIASDNVTQLKLNEVKDQYVKISVSLNHLNSGSNNIKKDLNAYKKVTDDQIENLYNSHNQTSDELNAYKKLTDERIEKIANLFLSINK